MDRRQAMNILLGSSLASGVRLPRPALAGESGKPMSEGRFGFTEVDGLAQKLAREPFQTPKPFPEDLRRLSYDQYRLIAARHERALWQEDSLPFRLEFYHGGYLFAEQVEMFLVEEGRARRFPFDPGLFQYRGEAASLRASREWGYAGFRILCQFPKLPHFQEFCSFLGASYFRAICRGQVYGISARGLAVNIALSMPEEFPRFRTFWIERPAPRASSLRVWALLDGPSVTGAYQFTITPGVQRTSLDVDAELHFRRDIGKLGVAPMSSMWAWDEGNRPDADPRPEVHDSDGLLIAGANGEWVWRPLAPRRTVSVSRLQFDSVKGLGLLQRDREIRHYRDQEALYHLRPSLWIEPRAPWGPGAVELLEVPSNTEIHDNIAAWWAPGQPCRSGGSLPLHYRVAFGASDPEQHGGGRFVDTTVKRLSASDVQFVLAIDGAALRALAGDTPIEPVVTADRGRIKAPVCSRAADGTWQVRFILSRDEDKPSELRAFVRRGRDVLSETWSYLDQ